MGWHKGNRSTNQGISREPPLPTNKFSPRSNLHRAPLFSPLLPLRHPILFPHVTLWESRDLVFRGWKSGSRRFISIAGRERHRAPASVLVLDLRCCPFNAPRRRSTSLEKSGTPQVEKIIRVHVLVKISLHDTI